MGPALLGGSWKEEDTSTLESPLTSDKINWNIGGTLEYWRRTKQKVWSSENGNNPPLVVSAMAAVCWCKQVLGTKTGFRDYTQRES